MQEEWWKHQKYFLICKRILEFPASQKRSLPSSLGLKTLMLLLLFNPSVVSNSLRPHGLQHARLLCPSPTPRACSNSSPSSQWCHPTISSSVIPFSCLQSFPALGSFPMSWLFSLGGQNNGASASVFPLNIQDWFPSGLTGLISMQFKGLSSFLQHHSAKASTPQSAAFFMAQLSHPYMTSGKTTDLTRQTFDGKVMSLFFNTLSRFVIAFLPRSKCLLISWLQSQSTVILEPKKIKSLTASIVSSSIYHEVMGPDAMIWVFWMLSFKPAFSPQCWCYGVIFLFKKCKFPKSTSATLLVPQILQCTLLGVKPPGQAATGPPLTALTVEQAAQTVARSTAWSKGFCPVGGGPRRGWIQVVKGAFLERAVSPLRPLKGWNGWSRLKMWREGGWGE